MVLRGQVELIREVFTYINRFKGQLFVIRIHSALLEHQDFPRLINDIALLHDNGIHIIVVPGARKYIDATLDSYGIESRSHHGIRISNEESIPFIKMAAFDVCNRIMSQLSSHGKNALIGNWVKARSLGVAHGVDYHFSGAVSKVQIPAITKALQEGYIPILPCIGWSNSGVAYNISSDELALSISGALKSKKLFFIEDRDLLNSTELKLPEGLESYDQRISKLTVDKAKELLDLNEIQGLNTLKLAVQAAERGVDRVHIVNGTIEGVVLKEIFSNLGIGTMVFTNIYEKIRPMESEDISGVMNLMAPLAEKGILIPRSRKSLENNIRDHVVYAVDETIHGTAALHNYEDNQGEIAGLAVDPDYIKLSIGQRLVNYLLEQAKLKGMKQVFVLTTQTSDWFQQLGFTNGTVDDLPASKQKNYNHHRKSRILTYKIE